MIIFILILAICIAIKISLNNKSHSSKKEDTSVSNNNDIQKTSYNKNKIKQKEKVLFYDENGNGVFLKDISSNLSLIFAKSEFDKILDKNYNGVISAYYESKAKKIEIIKKKNTCTINIYHENGNSMFQYLRSRYSAITFWTSISYSNIGKSTAYDLDEFSILLKSIPENNTIPEDIFILYKLLDTSDLNKFFIENNNNFLFYDEFMEVVTIEDLTENLTSLFDEYDLDEIFDKNHTEPVFAYYENESESEKIVIERKRNNCKITAYYENGNTMFEYNWANNSDVSFVQYSSDGKIISSKTYKFDDYSFFTKSLPQKNIIPIDILLLHKMLNTSNLDELISEANDHILFYDKNNDAVSLSEIKLFFSQDFDYDLDELFDINNSNGSFSAYYVSDRKKLIIDRNKNNYNVNAYYENGNTLFEYNRTNNSDIRFIQYSRNGEITASHNYKIDDFSDLFKALPKTNTIPYDILVLFKILNLYSIGKFIKLANDHILFRDKTENDVTLYQIKNDLFLVFDENNEEFDKLLDIDYIGVINGYHEDDTPRIIVDKNINSCNINAYYDNGNPIFEYQMSNNSKIIFNQYYSNGDIFSSKTYDLDDFSDLLISLPSNNTIPHGVLLLYKILNTDDLDTLLEATGESLLFLDKYDQYATTSNINEDLYIIFNRIDDTFNNILDNNYIGIISNSYLNENKKIVVEKNINNCNIDIYYENSNLMYKYNRPDNSTIVFSQYSPNGKLTSSETYTLDDFSVLINHIPEDNTIPNDILLLYKILRTSMLDELIKISNSHILFAPFKYKKSDTDNKDSKNLLEPENNVQDSNIEEVTNANSNSSVIKDGPFRLYYENNAVKSTGTYKNGKLDGLYMEYHTNGRVKKEGHYENGDKKGLWKFFTDSGKLEREESY